MGAKILHTTEHLTKNCSFLGIMPEVSYLGVPWLTREAASVICNVGLLLMDHEPTGALDVRVRR